MAKPGPLLRLVHSLERRRLGRSYGLSLTLRRTDAGTPVGGAVAASRQSAAGPRAFVVGAGERVDLAVPSHDLGPLLPRHVGVVTTPRADGVYVRAVSLHPERGLHVAPLEPGLADGRAAATPGMLLPPPSARNEDGSVGGALAKDGLRVLFDGLVLEVQASLDAPPERPPPGPVPRSGQILELYPLGQQLSFYAGASVRGVGDVVASVTGPGGGGHAIPALVASADEQPGVGGALVLRTRVGVHRVEVSDEEIRRGLLIGRSRRCVLGRGFDENDGLSRVHALVLGLEDGVFAFDLASRYGLRDVSRPSRLTPVSRLDDGIGCLVYGAGYLTFEA